VSGVLGELKDVNEDLEGFGDGSLLDRSNTTFLNCKPDGLISGEGG